MRISSSSFCSASPLSPLALAADAVGVALHGALQRRQARLRGACDALVAGLQRGQQRLDVAGDLGLLQAPGARPTRCRPPGSRRASATGSASALRAASAAARPRRRGFRPAPAGRPCRAPISCAWRARVRASVDCARASALWRASCSCMPPTFCHSAIAITRATTATSASRPKPMRDSSCAAAAWRDRRAPPARRTRRRGFRQAVRRAREWRSCQGFYRRDQGGHDGRETCARGRNRPRAPPARCARGWRRRGPRASRCRAARGTDWRSASELLKSQAAVARGAFRRQSALGRAEARRQAPVGDHACRTAPPAASISRASQSRPVACPAASPPRTISTRAPGRTCGRTRAHSASESNCAASVGRSVDRARRARRPRAARARCRGRWPSSAASPGSGASACAAKKCSTAAALTNISAS